LYPVVTSKLSSLGNSSGKYNYKDNKIEDEDKKSKELKEIEYREHGKKQPKMQLFC